MAPAAWRNILTGKRKEPGKCTICGGNLPEKDFYIVKIEGFYTPDMKEFSIEDIENATREEMIKLIENLRHSGAEELTELEEQVYKRYNFQMCRECYRRYITKPLPSRDELY
jgi:hypothetical protein